MVDGHDVAQVVERRVRYPAVDRKTGVVDEDVELPELSEGAVNHAVPRGLTGDIMLEQQEGAGGYGRRGPAPR